MRRVLFALLLLGALALAGCGYMLVEDLPGAVIVAPTESPAPGAEPAE